MQCGGLEILTTGVFTRRKSNDDEFKMDASSICLLDITIGGISMAMMTRQCSAVGFRENNGPFDGIECYVPVIKMSFQVRCVRLWS